MISVIVPVFNSQNYLRRCLDSIFAQEYKDLEVVAINDGSTDSSQEILEEYQKQYSTLRVINQENQGQAVARNAGIDQAKGEWIVFVDSDDEIQKDYLQALHDKANESTCDLVITRLKRVYIDKPSFMEKNFSYIHSMDLAKPITPSEKPELLTQIMSGPIAKLIRRSFVIDNNIRFASGLLYEDLYFTQSLLLCNPRVNSLNKDGYLYYIHSNSSMTGKNNRIFDMFKIFDQLIALANEKQVMNQYHDEIEYLAFYHIAIGTMYRLFRYQPLHFFTFRKQCANWLKQHQFSRKNKYIYQSSWVIKLYLTVFFS